MTFLFILGFILVLLIVWPILYSGLVLFGEWMTGPGPLGAGLFGFFNRRPELLDRLMPWMPKLQEASGKEKSRNSIGE